jgi:hypothetical protein
VPAFWIDAFEGGWGEAIWWLSVFLLPLTKTLWSVKVDVQGVAAWEMGEPKQRLNQYEP